MNKQLKMAIDMIVAGHNVETVIDITGISPELLFDVLSDMLDEQPVKVTLVTEWVETSIGSFELNLN